MKVKAMLCAGILAAAVLAGCGDDGGGAAANDADKSSEPVRVAVVLISHNLEHVAQVAHRAVVLRQGRLAGEAAPTEDNHEALVAMIVGASSRGGYA